MGSTCNQEFGNGHLLFVIAIIAFGDSLDGHSWRSRRHQHHGEEKDGVVWYDIRADGKEIDDGHGYTRPYDEAH